MLKVEIADEPRTLAKGLMFRSNLGPDRGMLFCFNKSQPLSFWGRNTLLPLDVAFVDKNHQITKIAYIKAMSDDLVKSEKDCIAAIEANLGYFSSHNIKEGQEIKIEKAGRKTAIISFS